MENQHRKIVGYRELSQAEIDLMNLVKEHSARTGELVQLMRSAPGLDQRWVAIGATDAQTAFMALTRAIAQPTTF